MVRRRQRERSLFELLLPDGHKLWPDWLRRIDTLLEDEAVSGVVAHALEARWGSVGAADDWARRPKWSFRIPTLDVTTRRPPSANPLKV